MSKRYNFNNNPVNTVKAESEEKTMMNAKENNLSANENIIPAIPADVPEKNQAMLRFIAEENNWKSPKAADWEEKGLKGYNFVIELEKAWKNAGRYYAYGFQAKHQNTALVHLERAYRLMGLEWNATMAWDLYISNGILRMAKDKVTGEEYCSISSKSTMNKKALKMMYRMVNGKSVILTNEAMDKALSEATARKGKKAAQTNEDKLRALIEAMGKENVVAMFKELLAA